MNKFRTLRADEIECRVSQVMDKGLTLLLYKDARCDQNVLDETVGPMNWQRRHTRDNANCIVGIWDGEKQMWIEKEDTGTESNTEAAKGLASDSFKRACFNWGIGRELYTAPRVYIPADKCNITERNGRKACYDNFVVTKIEYAPDGQREITALDIGIEKFGNVTPCYTWSSKKTGTTKSAPREVPAPAPVKKPTSLSHLLVCEKCGMVLHNIDGKDGNIVTPEEQANTSSKYTKGRLYCPDCLKTWLREKKEQEQAQA